MLKITLLWMLGAALLFPAAAAGSAAGQVEDIVTDTIAVGSTALWIEIAGDRLYVTNPEDGTIVTVDTESREIVGTIDAGAGVSVIEVVEDKNKIYATLLQNPRVHVFEMDSGEKIGEIDIGRADITLYSTADKPYGQREYITFDTDAVGLAYNQGTGMLYAVHSTVDSVAVIDTVSDTKRGDIPVGDSPLLIEIDVERNIGYVSNRNTNDVSVLDLESNTETKRLSTGFVPDQLAIDQSNNRLFVSHHGSPKVAVIDLRSQEIEAEIPLKAPTHSLAVDPNRDILHVSYLPESGLTGPGSIGVVEFIDTRTNKLVHSMDLDGNPFFVAIDPRGDRLFASNIADGELAVVDLQNEAEILGLDDNDPGAAQARPGAGGGCLIATAAYGTELAPQVQMLREVRDGAVMGTAAGAAFMSGFNQAYYSFSPTVADWERQNPAFQEAVRALITPMIATMIERIGPGTWSLAPPSDATVVATIAPSIHASGRFSHAGLYAAAPALASVLACRYAKARILGRTAPPSRPARPRP